MNTCFLCVSELGELMKRTRHMSSERMANLNVMNSACGETGVNLSLFTKKKVQGNRNRNHE